MFTSSRKSLKGINGGDDVILKENVDSPLGKPKNAYSEIADIFPALQKYKNEHSIANLQKLCAEIIQFCRSVYSSTKNDEERTIYRTMLEKLNI